MDVIVKAARTDFLPQHAVAGDACKRVRSINAPARGQPEENCYRNRKVQAIRRRLGQGRYDIDSRLSAILDKLLDDLLT